MSDSNPVERITICLCCEKAIMTVCTSAYSINPARLCKCHSSPQWVKGQKLPVCVPLAASLPVRMSQWRHRGPPAKLHFKACSNSNRDCFCGNEEHDDISPIGLQESVDMHTSRCTQQAWYGSDNEPRFVWLQHVTMWTRTSPAGYGIWF